MDHTYFDLLIPDPKACLYESNYKLKFMGMTKHNGAQVNVTVANIGLVKDMQNAILHDLSLLSTEIRDNSDKYEPLLLWARMVYLENLQQMTFRDDCIQKPEKQLLFDVCRNMKINTDTGNFLFLSGISHYDKM